MHTKRAIASARSFLGSNFDGIVDITGIEVKGKDWHLWQDVEGNTLKIYKTGFVKINPAKLPNNLTKDVFVKATPQEIAKHSYWVLAVFAKTKSLLCFLGNDGSLRCPYFEDKIWKHNISPLLLGYNTLRNISSWYLDTNTRKVKDITIMYPEGLDIEEVWASGYPSTDYELVERLKCHLISQG